jgi:8-oxo-dGTP diphosphatase
MMNTYVMPGIPHYPMPFVRIELAIMTVSPDGLAVLLGQREQVPHAGQWALPGGVLRIDLDADLDAAAQRVATERLGVTLPFLRQLGAVGSSQRDPRAPWAMSIVFRALVPPDAIKPLAGKRLNLIEWRSADTAAADTSLAFDHGQLIAQAIQVTRHEIDVLALPFEFLPDQFTLSELQSVCESILGRRLDKSSFRRRLDERALVEPVVGEMRTGAFRPAQLFKSRSDGNGI